jgi:hypothetical protein
MSIALIAKIIISAAISRSHATPASNLKVPLTRPIPNRVITAPSKQVLETAPVLQAATLPPEISNNTLTLSIFLLLLSCGMLQLFPCFGVTRHGNNHQHWQHGITTMSFIPH